ncbi:arginine deiminase-related protein [Isoptericola halotolerans]|uniref:Ornithine--oxo-acid transaminase n=1 Tax=Isoptericola halotolerans TaxID=300560 RepID=A0ABX2A9K8_9MICO|nr:dimethylargininase [Isoptericola halotolerans]NOV98476.1 ornithine--oxo-acid transaminase [Isoptericola halotolerans]
MTLLTPATPPATALQPTRARTATPRRFLMCPPVHFDVVYAINPWMDVTVPVDAGHAVVQWQALKAAYESRGHIVDVISPVPGLPDMVYAANGGIVVGGKALAARFTHPERQPEGTAYESWLNASGPARGVTSLGQAAERNEGEGDLLWDGEVMLAGTGFRTTRAAHAEVAARLDVEVVTLELVDPRFYHLDTALAVLSPAGTRSDGGTRAEIAFFPEAFTPESQAVLRERYPDAIEATEEDAVVLGLNAVSDGRHVFLSDRATGMHASLRGRGFEPVGIDLSELLKGGGSVKCCTLELRPAPSPTVPQSAKEARA